MLTMTESVAGSYMPNWKSRFLFMAVSFPQKIIRFSYKELYEL